MKARILMVGRFAAAVFLLAACDQSGSAKQDSGGSPAQSGPSAENETRIAKRYQVKSGTIEYTLSGMRTGTETLYWDDWGQREARLTKASVSMMGITQTTNSHVITLPDAVYTLDDAAKTAVKSANPAQEAMQGLSEKELQEFGRHMAEQMGAKEVGSDTVAGYSCTLWRTETMQTETCDHKGIPLRMTSNVGGMSVTTVATKIAMGEKVDPSHFEIPADYTVSEGPGAPPMPNMKDLMKGVAVPMQEP